MGMFLGGQNPRKALFKWEGDLAFFGSFFWCCKENEKQLASTMLLLICQREDLYPLLFQTLHSCIRQ